jgi:magnesium chelatase family protein
MLAHTFTAMMIGLTPLKIEVEVDGNRGTPHLIFIGLTSKATGEAKDRITAALQNCGIRIRSKRTIVNLAPADVPKTSSAFDLAIAVGILHMYGELKRPTQQTLFLGELALDGAVKRVRGALPLVLAAKEMGFTRVFFPAANSAELQHVSGIELYPLTHLRQYLDWDRGKPLQQLTALPYRADDEPTGITFDNIIGQHEAKRALALCAAGGHHILFTGPPGAGKSLLSQTLPSLLPPLTEEEATEVTKIHSISQPALNSLVTRRPFRAPHHTISRAGLIGGGNTLHPGEISLAHCGVLFLDEFLEFSTSTLEALRQPLEQNTITLTRAQNTCTYPAAFCLVAATNPCPCGYRNSPQRQCSCHSYSIAQYQKKLSGPLLDRFDLRISVQEVEQKTLIEHDANSTLAPAPFQVVKEQVAWARQKQNQRFTKTGIKTNAAIPAQDIAQFCPLTPAAKELLRQAYQTLQLSLRAYHKTIKVARTIADLEKSEGITDSHMAEALQYR